MEKLVSISVPPSFPEGRPLKAREMLSTAKGTMALGGISPEGQKVLGLVQESLNIADYAQGSEDSPKLEGNRFQNFQDTIDDIRVNGFSLKSLDSAISLVISIAKSHISHYETIKGSPTSLYIPFEEPISLIHELYSSANSALEDRQKYLNAEDPDKKCGAFLALTGTLIKFARNVANLTSCKSCASLVTAANSYLFVLERIISIRESSVLKDYQKWVDTEGSDEKHDAFFVLMKAEAKLAYNIVSLTGYLLYADLVVAANLCLTTLEHIVSIAGVIRDEYDSLPSIDVERQLGLPLKDNYLCR